VGLAGDRAGEQCLAGAGRPGHEHSARAPRPRRLVAGRVAQVIDHLADLGFHRRVAGHVGEPGSRPLGADDPRLCPGHAARPTEPAQARGLLAGTADREQDEAAEQQQWQEPEQRRQRR
jgi:hypothetical protein